MAKFWTWAEIKAKVQADTDTEDEDFVSPDELLGYANEGIKEAESCIHTIYEDYFLNNATISLVSGTAAYALPTDIYAHKIRSIIYDNGSLQFEIKRIREADKFRKFTDSKVYGSNQDYCYILLNSAAGQPKITLAPTPTESTANALTVWYLRCANRLTGDTVAPLADICDIPEFVTYVMQFMKVRIFEKEGNPNMQKAMDDLAKLRADMEGTLAGMVPDNDNRIEPDMRDYYDHV